MLHWLRKPSQADCILVSRMARDNEAKWQSAKSWFGGYPIIDPQRWPRSESSGLPLHHIAQIDLAEIPRGAATPALPKTGRLNFFAETQIEDDELAARVLFTEADATAMPAREPDDCPPLFGEFWSSSLPGAASPEEAPRVFRKWPMAFSFVASSAGEAAVGEALAALGPAPDGLHLFEKGGLGDVPDARFPWEAIRRIVNSLRQRLHEHDEAMQTLGSADAVRQFVDVWSQALRRFDPFDPIGDVVAQTMADHLHVLSRECGVRSGYGGGTSTLRDAASEVYRDMMVAPRRVFERIPAEIRTFLQTERRRSGWSDGTVHQMFGAWRSVQSDPDDFGDQIQLFYAESDDMLSWLWGDVGGIAFGISPEDLAARNWDKAWGLFQGH